MSPEVWSPWTAEFPLWRCFSKRGAFSCCLFYGSFFLQFCLQWLQWFFIGFISGDWLNPGGIVTIFAFTICLVSLWNTVLSVLEHFAKLECRVPLYTSSECFLIHLSALTSLVNCGETFPLPSMSRPYHCLRHIWHRISFPSLQFSLLIILIYSFW